MIALLVKASCILAIGLVFYKIVLEKESFFAANRLYLMGCLILTFIIPFVSLPKLVHQQGIITTLLERADQRESLARPEEPVRLETTRPVAIGQEHNFQKRETSLIDWILWIYYFGVIVFGLNLITQLVNLIGKVISTSDKVYDTDGILVNSSAGQEPCSFFKYIFIHPDSYDYDTYEQIVCHEKIHVRKWHGLDLIVAELASIFLWFNPLVWIFRKEVEKNIEYQTDELMVTAKTVDKETYQLNLVRVATPNQPLSLTTNYNQSLLKQRILKMSTKKSNPHNYWKYAFIAPLLLGILLVVNKPVAALAQQDNPEPTLSDNATTCSALLRAVKGKDRAVVTELLKTVNPNCWYEGDGEPRSPLVAAARAGDLVMGKLLVGAKADVEFHAPGDETPLMAASANGKLDFVRYLVAGGAKVNKKLTANGSALLVASRYGHAETVKYLISQGADVNSQVDQDGTPLICSVKSGHYEVAAILLEQGADPQLASPGDEYPMYHAVMSKNKAMIGLLKKYEKGD